MQPDGEVIVAKAPMPMQSPAAAYRGVDSAQVERQSGFSRPLADCRPWKWSSVIATGDLLQQRAIAITEDHSYGLQSTKDLLKALCLSNSAEIAPRYAGAGLCNGIEGLATITSCQAAPQLPESEPRLAATSTAFRPVRLGTAMPGGHVFLCSGAHQ